jgi:hypothetical protein
MSPGRSCARHGDTPREDGLAAQPSREGSAGRPSRPDVAVLGADHDEDEILVADVDDLARRRRLDVAEPAGPELARLARQPETCPPAVNEIELVLFLVEVRPRLDPGREHPRIRSEGRDPELRPDLADGAVAQLVHRRKGVPHGR